MAGSGEPALIRDAEVRDVGHSIAYVPEERRDLRGMHAEIETFHRAVHEERLEGTSADREASKLRKYGDLCARQCDTEDGLCG